MLSRPSRFDIEHIVRTQLMDRSIGEMTSNELTRFLGNVIYESIQEYDREIARSLKG